MKTLKLSQKKCIVWMLLYILFISHGSNILDFSNMNIVAPFTFIVLLLFFKFECKLTFELWILFGMLFVNYIITGTKATYTIKDGETLTRVALRFYGTKALWPYIVKYNPDIIKNPNHVPYGTTIKIPELVKK